MPAEALLNYSKCCPADKPKPHQQFMTGLMLRLASAQRIGSILAAHTACVAVQTRFNINESVLQTQRECCLFLELVSVSHFLSFLGSFAAYLHI